MKKGAVYLVGAGPGDPGLLTLRGAELVAKAEVLVYDYLASKEILNLAPKNCRLIYVGKQGGNHSHSQEEINQILVEQAQLGYLVVRLKGGDPYIFGRGGEEALALLEKGLYFEEVPGISSTIAAAAYAGIPLTHRDYSSQAVIMTGHENPEKKESANDWSALAKIGTISMVMGVKNLKGICENLIANGRDRLSPTAIVSWGTTSLQRTVEGPLESIYELAKTSKIEAPALFINGEVVSLRKKLNWFEKRPLFNKKILVTRSRQQASALSKELKELGAEVWEKPTIEIKPIQDKKLFEKIFSELARYDWLLFTSPNGVKIFMEQLLLAGKDARALAHLKIACVGPGTKKQLEQFALHADLVPEKYVAEGLLEALLNYENMNNKYVLLARASEGRDVLLKGLESVGALVNDFKVYETLKPIWDDDIINAPDLVTFTSASTAAGFAQMVAAEDRKNYNFASIGPITTEAALSLGFNLVVEAKEATIDSLVEAILEYFAVKSNASI